MIQLALEETSRHTTRARERRPAAAARVIFLIAEPPAIGGSSQAFSADDELQEQPHDDSHIARLPYY